MKKDQNLEGMKKGKVKQLQTGERDRIKESYSLIRHIFFRISF